LGRGKWRMGEGTFGFPPVAYLEKKECVTLPQTQEGSHDPSEKRKKLKREKRKEKESEEKKDPGYLLRKKSGEKKEAMTEDGRRDS